MEHGASRELSCQLGTDAHIERLRPLDLARRCSAKTEIIELLEYGLEGKPVSNGNEAPTVEEDTPQVKIWSMYQTTCDICFMVSALMLFKPAPRSFSPPTMLPRTRPDKLTNSKLANHRPYLRL